MPWSILLIEQQLQIATNRLKERVSLEQYKYHTEESPVTIRCAELPTAFYFGEEMDDYHQQPSKW